MTRSFTLPLAAVLILPFAPADASASTTKILVSDLTYDLAPADLSLHVAHFGVDLRVVGGSARDVTLRVQSAGTGAGTVGATIALVGETTPGVHHVDLYQDAPGGAMQVCVQGVANDAAGVHIETPDGACSGITTVLGVALPLA